MEAAAEPREIPLVRPDVKAAWEAYEAFGLNGKDDDDEEDDDDLSESCLCDRTLALSNLKLDECSIQFLADEWEKLQQQQQAVGAEESQENREEAPEDKKQKPDGPEENSNDAKDNDDADDDKREIEEESENIHHRVIEEVRLNHVALENEATVQALLQFLAQLSQQSGDGDEDQLRSIIMEGDRFDSPGDEVHACSEDHAALLLQGLVQVPSLWSLFVRDFAWVSQAVGDALQSMLSGGSWHEAAAAADEHPKNSDKEDEDAGAPPRFEIHFCDTLLDEEFVFPGLVQGLATRQGPGLDTLVLGNNRYGWLNNEQLTLLVNGTVGSTTQESLLRLSLFNQEFTAAFPELARLLQHCTNLRFLRLHCNDWLFHRERYGNLFNDDDVEAERPVDELVKAHFGTFVQTVQAHKKLLSLNFCACVLSNSMAAVLFKALEQNETLQILDIQPGHPPRANAGLTWGVADSLPKLKGLRGLGAEVDLSCPALQTGLRANSSLTDLYDCYVDESPWLHTTVLRRNWLLWRARGFLSPDNRPHLDATTWGLCLERLVVAEESEDEKAEESGSSNQQAAAAGSGVFVFLQATSSLAFHFWSTASTTGGCDDGRASTKKKSGVPSANSRLRPPWSRSSLFQSDLGNCFLADTTTISGKVVSCALLLG